jgi:proteasome lid subunit RPN8/RPN11
MKIKSSALQFALGVSRKIFPNEFSGLLRGDEKLIEEILVIPGTIFGENFSMQRRDLAPIDSTIIGTIHSHPGENFKPSRADMSFFKKLGFVHLIICYPYKSLRDVYAYDREGKRIELEVELEIIE